MSPIQLACVAGVERGRGRGNLGARESVWGAPKFPLLLPISTPATQAILSRHNRNCVVVVLKSVGFAVVVLIRSICIAVFITVSSVSPPANLVPRSLVDEPGSTTDLGTTHLTKRTRRLFITT